MHIVVVGLSHRTAPVEVREKLSIPDQSITESLKALKAFSVVLEVSILSTCNRNLHAQNNFVSGRSTEGGPSTTWTL